MQKEKIISEALESAGVIPDTRANIKLCMKVIELTLNDIENLIENIDRFKWTQEFLKRIDRGCFPPEAFDFTLKEIKEELKQKFHSQATKSSILNENAQDFSDGLASRSSVEQTPDTFNLSEKEVELEPNGRVMYWRDDVKEFIRLLKVYETEKIELAKKQDCLNEEEKGIHIRCCIDTKIFIDKLSGDKLICQE